VSLTLGWFLGRAADLTNIKRGSFHDEAGLEFPINAEHPDQRAALLAAFNGLGTQATLEAILAKLLATPATAAAQETQRVLLAQIASALATEGGYLDGVEGLLGTGNTSLAAIVTALAGTLKVQTPATGFVDVSVASLSAGQAAGTASVIAANANRRVFAITPTNDGRLYIATAAGNGFYWPLYAGVTRVLSGVDCPTNALFVTGQTAGTALPMAEG
jgi:hypothetical protein